MSILVFIILGGIVGSLIGGFLSQLITGNTAYLSLALGDFLWSLLGALILVAILNAVSRTHHA